MVCNQALSSTNIMDKMWCEKKWIMMYDSTFNTITIIKRCDHNHEVSSYVCNAFRLALIWQGNSFEEIYKWEILVYIFCYRMIFQLCFSLKHLYQPLDSSIYVSIDVFFKKLLRTWLYCSSKYFSFSSSFSKSFIKMFAA